MIFCEKKNVEYASPTLCLYEFVKLHIPSISPLQTMAAYTSDSITHLLAKCSTLCYFIQRFYNMDSSSLLMIHVVLICHVCDVQHHYILWTLWFLQITTISPATINGKFFILLGFFANTPVKSHGIKNGCQSCWKRQLSHAK